MSRRLHGHIYGVPGLWYAEVYIGARHNFSHRFEHYEDALAWTRLKIKELTA